MSRFQQCCGTGSGIRCLFDLGIRNWFFLDPWSRWKLSDNFRGKISIILWILAQMFFFSFFKNKIIFNFVKFMATKKGTYDNKFFFRPFLLLLFLERWKKHSVSSSHVTVQVWNMASRSLLVTLPQPTVISFLPTNLSLLPVPYLFLLV